MPENKLLLVDGTNVLYRAFFAIKGLATKAGRPTNAVFGFIRMLRQMEKIWRPTHWVVVLDGGTPEERLNLLPEYKANRAPMPDALREQFAPAMDYLDRAKIPTIRLEGCEADDVLASLARRGEGEFDEILIATTDKDLYQLVNARIAVVAPSKEPMKMGPGDVLLKTGVSPSRIVEWLALCGDAVDNVPGVPGMGPKTAARLLAENPSLEEALASPASVASEKVREILLAHRDQILRNLRVIRLRSDLGGLPPSAELRILPEEPARLLPFFEEMEFHSMAEALRTGLLF